MDIAIDIESENVLGTRLVTRLGAATFAGIELRTALVDGGREATDPARVESLVGFDLNPVGIDANQRGMRPGQLGEQWAAGMD